MHFLLNLAFAITPDERDGEARRNRIMEELQARPGQSMAELSRSVGLAWTTTHYHVRRLQASGLLRVRRIGKAKRHFPVNGPRLHDAVAASPVRQAILTQLTRQPTAGIAQLARAMGRSPQTVRSNVRALERLGLVEHGGQYHKRFTLTTEGMDAAREAEGLMQHNLLDSVASVKA